MWKHRKNNLKWLFSQSAFFLSPFTQTEPTRDYSENMIPIKIALKALCLPYWSSLKSKLVKVTTTGSQPYLRIKIKQQYIVVRFYKYSSLKYFFPRVCCDISQRHLKPNLISSPLSPQWKSELTTHNLSLTITDNRSRCHCRANQSPVIRNQNG